MPDGDNHIFPIADRPAPLLSRIRDGRGADFGEQSADKITEFIKSNDPEVAADEMERLTESFIDRLASNMGVGTSQIDRSAVENFVAMLDMTEDAVLSTKGDEEETLPSNETMDELPSEEGSDVMEDGKVGEEEDEIEETTFGE